MNAWSSTLKPTWTNLTESAGIWLARHSYLCLRKRLRMAYLKTHKISWKRSKQAMTVQAPDSICRALIVLSQKSAKRDNVDSNKWSSSVFCNWCLFRPSMNSWARTRCIVHILRDIWCNWWNAWASHSISPRNSMRIATCVWLYGDLVSFLIGILFLGHRCVTRGSMVTRFHEAIAQSTQARDIQWWLLCIGAHAYVR